MRCGVRLPLSLSRSSVQLSTGTADPHHWSAEALVANYSESRWQAVQVAMAQPWLKCAVREVPPKEETYSARQTWKLMFTCDSEEDLAQVPMSQVVQIQANDKAEQPPVEMLVLVPLQPPVRLFPTIVFFPSLVPGASSTTSLKFALNEKLDPDTFRNCEFTADFPIPLEHRWSEAADGLLVMEITAHPLKTEEGGVVTGKIQLSHPNWHFNSIEIPVSAGWQAHHSE